MRNKTIRFRLSLSIGIALISLLVNSLEAQVQYADTASMLAPYLRKTNAEDAYIPYIGATKAVDLGTFDLKVNSIKVGRGGGSNTVNMAIGWDALLNNTSGDLNTAIGYYTLRTNAATDATQNTAVGAYSLANNNTYGNTGIGSRALYNNTTGYENTGLGRNALVANTTGVYNSALGSMTLYKNVSGNRNVAVGNGTLFNNTASDNTSVGAYCMYSNSTGRSNTALGIYSSYNNTSGYSNTTIGSSASFTSTTSYNNTVIGYNAFYAGTGSNNTIIGANASTVNSGDNSVVLITDGNGGARFYSPSSGNILLGTVADNGNKLQVQGSASISGNVTMSDINGANAYLNGKVGIGTPIPSGSIALAVNGDIKTKKVIVSQTSWADYVFDSSYQLPTLDSVESFIQTNKRLPDMPSTAEVTNKGLDVGEMQKLLLKKVEELTLYVIELKKKNDNLETENTDLKKRMQVVEQRTRQ
ncbi:MAG: hypothetical protein J0I41_00470 [Filimonas sp.]|nr:hypothetical protein [Filimonas sp.]